MIYGFSQLIETKEEEHLHLQGKHSQKAHGRGGINRSGPPEEIPGDLKKEFKSANTVPIASGEFTHTQKVFASHEEIREHVNATWVRDVPPGVGRFSGDTQRVTLEGNLNAVPVERLGEVVNTLDDLKAEFPNSFFHMDKVEVPFEHQLSEYRMKNEWAHVQSPLGTGSSTMRLNPKHFGKPVGQLEDEVAGGAVPWFGEKHPFHPTGTGSIRGVVTHEFGHVVWSKTYNNAAPKGSPGNLGGKYDPVTFANKSRGQMVRLSQYAGKSNHEAFAESFSYLYGRSGTFSAPKGSRSRFLEYKGPEHLHDVNKYVNAWRQWL